LDDVLAEESAREGDVIGCEKLCGDCTACGALVWALNALSAGYPLAEAVARRTRFGKAALDPSSLAELLARALRGRDVGAKVECNRGVQYRIVYYLGGVRLWVATNRGNSEVIPSARAKLCRLLAGGLCEPEEALRLLETT
jgi:hypothetical protein